MDPCQPGVPFGCRSPRQPGPYSTPINSQRAHDLVYDICREALRSGRPFLDLLAENTEITPHMGRAELALLVDPANYLGLCGEMVDRVLDREPRP